MRVGLRTYDGGCPLLEQLEPRLLLDGAVSSVDRPNVPDLLASHDTGVSDHDNVTALNNSSPGQVLVFRVAGVLTGNVVALYADGVLVGQTPPDEEADDHAVVVATDGLTALAYGWHEITAVQLVPSEAPPEQWVRSEPSEPLAVSILTDEAGFSVADFALLSTAGATTVLQGLISITNAELYADGSLIWGSSVFLKTHQAHGLDSLVDHVAAGGSALDDADGSTVSTPVTDGEPEPDEPQAGDQPSSGGEGLRDRHPREETVSGTPARPVDSVRGRGTGIGPEAIGKGTARHQVPSGATDQADHKADEIFQLTLPALPRAAHGLGLAHGGQAILGQSDVDVEGRLGSDTGVGVPLPVSSSADREQADRTAIAAGSSRVFFRETGFDRSEPALGLAENIARAEGPIDAVIAVGVLHGLLYPPQVPQLLGLHVKLAVRDLLRIDPEAADPARPGVSHS